MTTPARTPTPAARLGRTLGRLKRRTRRVVLGRRPQHVVAILGMHRAGTSSLAGSLEEAGLFLGDVRGRGHWNRKGNRESKVLMQLHEDVLRANGGSWRRPPEQVQWGAEHRARLERFIGARQGRPVWGFKDPRTLLVIDGWLEAVPDLDMVATVRHPAAVARSLQRRSGSPSAEPWLELWLDYNRRLLDLHERHAFPIIDFDLPAEEYQARLATLIEGLGLRAPMGKEAFFEPSLRNPTPEDPALTDEIESVYRELCEIAAVSGDGGAGDRADGAGDRADGAEAAAPGEPAGGSGHEPAHRG